MAHTGGDSSTGLPPAPHKVDASQAQAIRLQDAYWSDEEVSKLLKSAIVPLQSRSEF